MTRALIFDVDGVLADTEHLHKQALATAAIEAGYVVLDNDATTTTAKLLAAGVPEAEVPGIYAHKRKIYEVLIQTVDKNPELAKALYRIARRHPIGACTNSNRDSSTLLLKHLGILEVFSTIVTSSDVKRGKPAPDIYTLAVQKLDTAPGNVCVFEDSDVGETAARRAGVAQIIRCTTATLLEELQTWS
jgi:HAD superfamily hydrolase (TIGR01509 family)